MQTDEFYIPAIQSYSKIEQAYQTCGSDDIIPLAWGARSRVVGNCVEYRGDVGQCLGAFKSQDVDTRDTPWGCVSSTNVVTAACRIPPNTPVNSNPPNPMPNPPVNLPPVNNSPLPKPQPHPTPNSSSTTNSNSKLPPNYVNINVAKESANNGYGNPYAGKANPYMSYDVFDKAYLERGLQSNSDPAGYLMGLPTLNNFMKLAEQSSQVPNKGWGPCSSFGNYGSSASSALSGSSCIGNCALGEYARSRVPKKFA
jgi:hypothetical protein